MVKFIAQTRAYLADESGATAIEYGLIAAGISLAIVAALFTFGDQLRTVFDSMSGSMDEAIERIEEGSED